MNLKKSVLSFMAAGAILAGGFAGVAAQDAGSDTMPLTVTVTADGLWGVQFCEGSDGAFGEIILDSTHYNQDPLEAQAIVCYADTKVQRDAFDTHLSASDFSGTEDTENKIAASNLTLGHVGIMNSGQWDGQNGPIGEISALTGAGNTAVGTHDGADWVGGTLNTSPRIHTGYAGVGTGGNKYETTEDPLNPGNDFELEPRSNAGSWHVMELLLDVPETTVSDIYNSTLTINVSWTGDAQP